MQVLPSSATSIFLPHSILNSISFLPHLWCQSKNTDKLNRPTQTGNSALLATLAQNKCTALVCSCYAPSRSLVTRVEQDHRNKRSSHRSSKRRSLVEKKRYEVIEQIHDCEHLKLKSNLKKTEEEKHKTEPRKVSWPDAHGRDIAHVKEFEPSVSEDGDLEGVRNSCVCTIQ